MRKKWLVLGSIAGISSVVLVTSGFSALASTSGYDAYKTALKNTHTVKSVSVTAGALVQDNGSVLIQANGSGKADLENKTGSGKVTIQNSGTEQTLSVFRQAGEMIFNSSTSPIYYVQQEKVESGKRGKEDINRPIPAEVENVVDSLVGNLKDYVKLDEKAGGTKEVSLQLTNTQLPAVVNAVGSLLIKQAADEGQLGKEKGKQEASPFGDQFKLTVPALTQDIKIEKIAVKADINANNYIQHQEADLTVSGKDKAGVAHQVVLHVNADLSDYNSTTPDKADLTGKTVQTLQRDHKMGK